VDAHHKDAYALDFLGDVLSTGRSSRLYQRLVDKDQLALQAGSFPFTLDKSGLFAFFCIANQGAEMDAIKKAINEELVRIQKEGITEEEFQKVRNAKEGEFARQFLSLDGKLGSLARYSLFYKDTKLVNEEYKKYMAVTRDDIKRVANAYLKPDRKNTVLYVVMKQDEKDNGK
jgi:predicted Zn-dependent peptidase